MPSALSPTSKWLIYGLGGLLLGLLGYWLGLQFLASHQTDYNYLFNGAYGLVFLIGGLIGVFGRRSLLSDSSVSQGALMLGISLLCNSFGQFLWMYYNLVARIDIPYPSLADLMFILFYPFAAWGIWSLFSGFRSLVSIKLVFESVCVVIIVTLISIFCFYRPESHLSFMEQLFNLAYPLGDALLLGLIYISIRIFAHKFYSSLLILISGIILETIADFLFLYRTNNQTYWNGDISDLVYVFASLTLTIGLIFILRADDRKIEIINR